MTQCKTGLKRTGKEFWISLSIKTRDNKKKRRRHTLRKRSGHGLIRSTETPFLPIAIAPEIYEQDSKYGSIFNLKSDVRNILFIYRLGETIGLVKMSLNKNITMGKSSEYDAETL